jgi:uncharacterized protein
MHNICHFEIPVDNSERAQKFYGELFGWSFDNMTIGGTSYWSIKTPDGIGGGLMQRQMNGQQPVNYVLVTSVQESLDKAGKLGANVLVGRTPVPGMGWFAIVQDTENNTIGLWEEDKHAS